MQLRLTIVDADHRGSESASTDVVVDAPGGAVFGDLRPLLVRPRAADGDDVDGDGDTAQRFEVNGRDLEDDAVLGEPPLLRGAVIVRTCALPARMPSPPVGLVDLRVVGGPGAGRTVRLPRGDHVVGRSTASAVRLTDAGASRAHCVVSVGDGVVTVRDLEPANPSRLDGVPLPGPGARLEPGAVLRVGSTTLAVRARSTSPRPHGVHEGRVLVHVRPRFSGSSPPAELTLPEEPRAGEGQRLPLLAALAPLVLSGALALAMQSAVMLLFALMSPVLLLGQWWSDRRHGRRSHRSRMRQHRAAVARAGVELQGALDAETRRRHEEQPDLCHVQELLDQRGARLWERRPHDEDWLALRVGTATQPARTSLAGAPGHDPLVVADVPVVVDLARTPVLGVVGPRSEALSLAGSLVTQVAAWHSPRRTQVALLTSSSVSERDWSWASLLPHLMTSAADETGRRASARDPGGLAALVSALAALVAQRQDDARVPATGPGAGASGRADTDVVVILDGALELRAVPGVADLLRDGPTNGLRFICLDHDRSGVPAETVTVIELGRSGAAASMTTSGLALSGITADLPDPTWLTRAGRALAPLTDATPDVDDAALPTTVGFRDLHRRAGLDPLDPVALAGSWATAGTTTAGRTTPHGARALVGVTAAGPLELDLTRDGPHALIGGTTGSGKSELLRSLVAGLAVAHRPDDLSLRPRRLQGWSGLPRLCSSASHPGSRHRPRRPSHPARPGLARGRAATAREPAGAGRCPRPRRLPVPGRDRR